MLVDTRYFLFFPPMRTRINPKVFRLVSWPHTIVNVRNTYSPNRAHIPASIVLVLYWWPLQMPVAPETAQTSEFKWPICWDRWNTWKQYISPLNFRFKVVASMTLFSVFFTDILAPLQSRGELMFRRKTTGAPIFNAKMCGGIPDK